MDYVTLHPDHVLLLQLYMQQLARGVCALESSSLEVFSEFRMEGHRMTSLWVYVQCKPSYLSVGLCRSTRDGSLVKQQLHILAGC